MADEIVTTTPAAEADGDVKTWKRRGWLAAVWAAVASIVIKQKAELVEAANGNNVVLGAANTETISTTITTTPNSAGDQVALTVRSIASNAGTGLYAEGSLSGVRGVLAGTFSEGGAGVVGMADRADSYGVQAINSAGSGSAVGVYGASFSPDGRGMFASGYANGLFGQTWPSSTTNGIAVYGSNLSSYAGPGPGAGGFGVYGFSAKGHGLVGATQSAGGAAVVGATNGVAGAYAGVFYGPVVVSGSFLVLGAKSAAVPHPDGSHRLLYCMESPESWFEDFGKGQLECGRAEVTIDPNFAAVADMEDYHVFVTVYNQHHDLMVSEQTPLGFRVQAKDATSASRFSWRVVAKRKDIVAERLATVTIPSEPQLPTEPPTHEAPPDFRSPMVPH